GDLLDQRGDAVELLLAAQSMQKVEPQRRAVDVAGEIEQVGFDGAPRAVKGRPYAHVRHRAVVPVVQPGAADVDPIAGQHPLLIYGDIGGREADLTATPVAFDHRAANGERAAEQRRGLLDIAGAQQFADARRADRGAVETERLDRM